MCSVSHVRYSDMIDWNTKKFPKVIAFGSEKRLLEDLNNVGFPIVMDRMVTEALHISVSTIRLDL